MNRLGMALAAALVAATLAGCGGRMASTNREVDQPVSQQVAVGDSRQRAKIHTELGSLYLGDGRLSTALDEARTAAASDSGYAPAYNLLGLVYMSLRDNAYAEENFGRALRLAPGDAEINNNYGWFLCQTGRERQSIAYFESAMRSPLYSTPVKPITNAGICTLRVKDDKSAEGYFRSALRYDSGNVTAMFWLADILYRQNHLGEARVHIDEVHRRSEPSAESLWLAVRIERRFGDRESEARYAAQLRHKFAGSPEFQKLMQGEYE